MSDAHGDIIAAAAKAEFGSLGLRQIGRSRLWIADHECWLNVVEFTPSRWSKSVSLMNAAHWLWAGAGYMSFDEAIPSNRYAEFDTEDQFRRACAEIAKEARVKVLEIEERFASFDAIAKFVVERARSSPERMGPSWWGYKAGIASGLVGRWDDADYFLRRITDERVRGYAELFLPLINRPENFKNKVNEGLAQQRAALRLPPLLSAAF